MNTNIKITIIIMSTIIIKIIIKIITFDQIY